MSIGSIYRVTKKVCVDKSAAIRDGVIKRSDKGAKARMTARRASASNPMAQERKQLSAAHHDAAPRKRDQATHQAPIQTPALSQSSDYRSPYGILLDPWRVGDFIAPLQTRFSLQLATQD